MRSFFLSGLISGALSSRELEGPDEKCIATCGSLESHDDTPGDRPTLWREPLACMILPLTLIGDLARSCTGGLEDVQPQCVLEEILSNESVSGLGCHDLCGPGC